MKALAVLKNTNPLKHALALLKSRVSSFTHTENNGGNPQSQNFTYGYNTSEDRVSQVSPLGSVTYNYDINSHKLLNLTGAVNKTFSYDVMGNLISDNLNNFIYNSANRLSQATSIQYGTTQYSYNGYGQRVNKQRVKNGEIHNNWFIYNGTDLMYEEIQLDNNYPLEVEYIYFNGEIIALVQNNVIYYVQTDHLGTPRVIVNSENNNVVWSWKNKEAFGDNPPVENGLTFNLRFSGQYYDEEKENSYNIQRDYSSALGRYIQSDPIGLNGGINTYFYVENNPLSFTDSQGLAVDVILFAPFEFNRYVTAFLYQNDPDRFSVAGHANSSAGMAKTNLFNRKIPIAPELLVKLIQDHPKYKPGMPVDLLGCNTGRLNKEDRQYAQKVANLLKAPVRGPDNYLWFSIFDGLKIYGKNEEGMKDLTVEGKYNDFYPK